jgi:AcrR family transcriptional regulator
MPRTIPSDRLEQLARTATEVFIRQGYRRTQMADVAEAMGVAKGTLYLYVESKEALLDLALRYADHEGGVELPDNLPLATPAPGATVEYARSQFAARAEMPLLLAAIHSDAPADIRAEVDAITRELFELGRANRRSIKLIDRCAPDHPELGALWFETGRGGLMQSMILYLDARPQLTTGYADNAVLARMIIETITLWAVHLHWDPHPQGIDENTAEETVVSFIRRALTQEVTS